jgi:hypothetical protein
MQPGIGGDKFEAAKHQGHLLLFFPTSYDQNIPTVNGSADAITTRIVDLDTGEVLNDAKVWGKAMVPQLKGAVPDGMVLGRIAQGQSKGGNNPPWLIQPHTEQDVPRAEAWLAANPRNQFGQPSQQQAPAPQQGGWGQAPSGQPAQGGWGAPAPAPASPAPATGGWGAPPAQQNQWGAPAAAAPNPAPSAPAPQYGPPAGAQPTQTQFPGQWGNAAPQPTPPQVDPGLVEALVQRGVPREQIVSQEQAEGIAASMGLTRG